MIDVNGVNFEEVNIMAISDDELNDLVGGAGAQPLPLAISGH